MIEFDKVTTRGGDRGETSLYNGKRLRKDDLLIETLGDNDELGSFLGVAKAVSRDRKLKKILSDIQEDLVRIGAMIATPPGDPLNETFSPLLPRDTERLEKIEKAYLRRAEIPEAFILPGETPTSAHLDVARSVCRRVERKVVACIRERNLGQLIPCQHYLNRLSDLLFILARYLSEQTQSTRKK